MNLERSIEDAKKALSDLEDVHNDLSGVVDRDICVKIFDAMAEIRDYLLADAEEAKEQLLDRHSA